MPAPAEPDLHLALRLADAADAVTMGWFTGAPIDAETKHDGSPVTEADRAVERCVAEIVATERPGDGLLGEEIGAAGPRRRRWIVDGIDGTVNFVRGERRWGTEIALEVDGEIVVGVSTSPALAARWWASRGGGAWRAATDAGRAADAGDSTGRPRRLRVGTGDPGRYRATVVPPLGALPDDQQELAERLTAHARYVAPTVHGALMVAEGTVAACLQPTGGPWDFAAPSLVVEEAGGRFSDLAGRRVIDGGGPLVYSDDVVHDAVLAHLSGLD